MIFQRWTRIITETLFAALVIPVSLAAQNNPEPQHVHYALGVLGTLGGGFGSEAWGVNDRGSITGHSALPDITYHAFFWQRGVMKDLGPISEP